MDKLMEEEDLKGLEEEIDNAVDRLFVERKKDREETFAMNSPMVEPPSKPSALEPSMMPPVFESPMKPHSFEPSVKSPIIEPPMKSHSVEASLESPPMEPSLESFLLEPSFEFERNLETKRPLETERPLDIPPARPAATSPAPSAPPVRPEAAPPIPFLKSIERMEAQLLSLEWEITREKLEKAREEILALKELLRQKADMTSILGSMENVVSRMIRNEEDIRPAWIKFLLDSKETVKLLMKKETGAEIDIYKQLAYMGIEARFSCLEGTRDAQLSPPSLKEREVQVSELSVSGEEKIEEMSRNVQNFMKRVEDIFGTIQEQIFKLEEASRKLPPSTPEARSPLIPAMNVTIFKVEEKLLGVESGKVFKLFRVPNTFEENYSDQQKIRLRDVEVKMVDLRKLLAIQGGGPKEQIRILTVKEKGEYKGFMVDEVLKRVWIPPEKRAEADGYFSGVVPINYQEEAMEIPILDLTKF